MKQNILFVDDDTNLLKALTRALNEEPYEISLAKSAQQALEILENQPIDVVVSDEKMPGMSGAELLTRIQQKYPLTVRIMLTGQADIQAAARAINEGRIYRFLIKPCYEDLAVTIRQALQQRELMVESNKLLKLAQQQADFIDEITESIPQINGFGPWSDEEPNDDSPPDDVDELIQQIKAIASNR